MKKTTMALTLATLITLSQGAHALELMVVNNYDLAASTEVWHKAKTDQVPAVLLSHENVARPAMAYSELFPKAFMQEALFAVCYQDCSQKDGFTVKGDAISERELARWDVVEQANVYFWLNKYFSFLDEKLSYRPSKFLKVMTKREIRSETNGKILKNNAFFNPGDISLSFLPANKNILFTMLAGKINRSGFDPSVIVHEASHYLFHHLFPDAVNSEIGGLNEGFADYMANIFLNNSKMGLVMLHGKTLRDSAVEVDSAGRFKTYAPKMEVHDLGERVSLALWKTREVAENKNELDRLVIDAIISMRSNPYSGVHDFKEKMLDRISSVVGPRHLKSIHSLWENIFSGSAKTIAHTDFLNSGINENAMIGFRTRQVLPQEIAQDYGVPAVTEANYVFLNEIKITDDQKATLIGTEEDSELQKYWIVHDTSRLNILGIYDEDQELITNGKKLAQIKGLAEKAQNNEKAIESFASKVQSFAQLSQGKGELGLFYKVKGVRSSEYSAKLNGGSLRGQKIEIDLKRKAIIARVLGLPEITQVTLYAAQEEIKNFPQINGLTIIGYKLLLKNGVTDEMILDKIAR